MYTEIENEIKKTNWGKGTQLKTNGDELIITPPIVSKLVMRDLMRLTDENQLSFLINRDLKIIVFKP